MKKIIRIASVIALASASLLYVGCTKDFSGDITRLENTDTELSKEIKDVNDALESFKSTANAAIEANAAEIAKKADKTTVDDLKKEIGDLKPLVNDNASAIAQLKKDVKAAADNATKALKEIETINGKIGEINKAIESINTKLGEFEKAIETLKAQVAALQVRITNIVWNPSVYPEAIDFCLYDDETEDYPIDRMAFDAEFMVSPKAAAKQITAEDLTLYVKEGITKADAPVSLEVEIESVEVKDDVISVHASFPYVGAHTDNTNLYFAAKYEGEDKAGESYEVISDFTPVTTYHCYLNDPSIYAWYVDGEAVEGPAVVNDTLVYGDVTTVKSVVPSMDLRVDGLTLDELAEYIGVEALVAEPTDTSYAHKTWADVTGGISGNFTVEPKNGKFDVKAKMNYNRAPQAGSWQEVSLIKWTINGVLIDEIPSTSARVNVIKKQTVVDLGTWSGNVWTWERTLTDTKIVSDAEKAAAIGEVFGTRGQLDETGNFTLDANTGYVEITVDRVKVQAEEPTTIDVVWKHNFTDPNEELVVKLAYECPVIPAAIDIDLGAKDTVFIAFDEDLVVEVEAADAIAEAVAAIVAEDEIEDFIARLGRPGRELVGGLNIAEETVTYEDLDGYATYKDTSKVAINGLEFTFTHAVNVIKPATTLLVKKTPYVINDTVLVGGEILPVSGYTPGERPTWIPAAVWTWITGIIENITVTNQYVLNVTPMNQYFEVADAEDMEGLYVEFSDTLSVAGPVLAETADVTAGVLDPDALLDWNGYNEKSYTVIAKLFTPGGVMLDSTSVVFVTEDPLAVSVNGTVNFEHKSVTTSESVTLLDHIVIQSLKNEAYLTTSAGEFNLTEALPYGVKIDFAGADEWIEKDGKDISNFGEIFSIENSGNNAYKPVLKLEANQALFQDEYTISVPFKVSYNYGNSAEGVLTVNIK